MAALTTEQAVTAHRATQWAAFSVIDPTRAHHDRHPLLLEGVHPDEMTTAFLVDVMQLADDHHLRLHALSVLDPADHDQH